MNTKGRYLSSLAGIVSLILLLILASGCGSSKTPALLTTEARPVTSTPGYLFWEQHYAGYRCLQAAEGELNGDDQPDLLIIYRDEVNACFLVAVINAEPDFQVTTPFSAPVSDQVIDIFNMDGTSPNEFSVSGRKGVNIGSAVFRLENGQIVQLFSSGYGDCC
jgi:hypothetical protein